MKVSLLLAALEARPEPLRSPVHLARIADEAGVDRVTVSDHVVMGSRTDRYPFGDFPRTQSGSWPDPLILLAAMAAATDRIQLGTQVLVLPLRPAVVAATQVATLDSLSDGRVVLGVGAGWQREEFDAAGVPFSNRWQRVDDAVSACRRLWTGNRVSLETSTVSFDDVICLPTPATNRVPVWFGGKATSRMAARIAHLGDGWFPRPKAPLPEIREGIQLIRAAMSNSGRKLTELGVATALGLSGSAGSWDGTELSQRVTALADAGVTHATIGIPRAISDRTELRSHLTTAVERIEDTTGIHKTGQ